MDKELEALERLYKCNDDDYTLGYQQHDYKLLQKALLKEQEREKEFGCPLDTMVKALKQSTFKGLYFDAVDTDGFKRKGFIKCYLDYDGFNNRFFWNTGWNSDIWLSSYKKTWWLKEDRSE